MSQKNSSQLFWYRVKFLTLIAVFLSPFVGGWLALYVFNVRPPSGNYGTLVQPVKKLKLPRLETMDGHSLVGGFGRKWTFLVFSGESCASTCRSNLYYLRQIRISLGRDSTRMQNILITASPVDADLQAFLRDYPNLVVVANNRKLKIYSQFELDSLEPVGRSPVIYLIDPDQNLMMYYPAENDQNRILDDIRKLMKLSQIG